MATDARQLYTAPFVANRREERRAIAVGIAEVQGETGTATGSLLDLSIYGCRLAVAGAHDNGTRIWLRFEGGWPIAAHVVWRDNDRIGCRFDEPIPGSLMRDLTRALN